MLGLICGLKSEENIAQKIAGAKIANAAARPEEARRLAHLLADNGATHLLSFGLAAALSPHLKAGDCLFPTEVRSGSQHWPCDPAWLSKLQSLWPTALSGPIAGSDILVVTAKEKNALCNATHCLAVDMESHAVAEVAHERNLPFAVIRVIADTSSMELPPAAQVPLNMDGSVNFCDVMRSILGHPTQIPDLIRLGLCTGKALHVLRQIAQRI